MTAHNRPSGGPSTDTGPTGPDAETQPADDVRLGAALREARLASGISLREMARSLGVSPSHLSQIERDLTSPSVNTTYRMVQLLGMSFDDLFAGINEPGEDRRSSEAESDQRDVRTDDGVRGKVGVVRAEKRHAIALAGGVRWELLTPSVERDFEFVEYVYDVGGTDGDDFLRYEGREHGLVLEGRLAGSVGFETFELGPGDCVTFDSTIPHRFWNIGAVPARAIWIDRRARVEHPSD
jgi:transcriptional regulator with XRE-family HTH domain